jgi:2-acylglycerol O-acyltransferase 2
VFRTWREYFQYSYLNEATLDPKKNYIFIEFPHGVFPLSELIAGEQYTHIHTYIHIHTGDLSC